MGMLTAEQSAPRWVLPAALAGAVGAGSVAFVNPLVGAALLAPVVVALLLLRRAYAVPILLIFSALNRFGLQSGDAHIHLEIVATVLLLIALVNRLLVRTSAMTDLRSPLWPALAAYVLVNVVSSILFAHERTRALKLDAEIVAAAATYLVFLALLRNERDVRQAIRWVWILTVGEASLGLVLIVGYLTHITSYGVQFDAFGLPMAYGTQWEANIFGSFLLGNFFVLLGDYARGNRTAGHSLGLILVLAGIAASMTRTVWLALLLGMLVFALLAARVQRPNVRVLPILAAIPIVALGGLVLGSATPFAGRLLDVVNLQSSSASGRLVAFQAAISDWRTHPLLGSGTGSFNFNAVPGQPHPWMGNLTLLTLQDVGLIGTAALVVLVVRFGRQAWAAVCRGDEWSLCAAGSIASLTALLLAFQATTGFWFAYTWILIALGTGISRLGETPA